MAADDEIDIKSCKYGYESLFRRESGKDLRFASRRAMAEQRVPQILDSDAVSFRPASQLISVLRMNLQCSPAQDGAMRLRKWLARCRSPIRNPFRVGDTDLCEYRKVAIAVDKRHWNVQRTEERERCTRHRAGKDVAPNDYLVDVGNANLFEHCLERRKVCMNVVQSRDAHGMPPQRSG